MFIGESYTFFLENFQNSYTQIGYYFPTGEAEEKMNEEIRKRAEAFDTAVFALDKENEGAFSRTIIVYGNEEVKKCLKDDWNIKAGTVRSFFSGTTTFLFEPFENADEKVMQNCWYPNQEPESLYEMVYPGMVRYSGSFRNEPAPASSKLVTGGIWMIVLFAIALLTMYDIAYGKKEQSIRILLGADNHRLQIHKIFCDIIGFSISVILAFLLLLPFTAPSFEAAVTILCIFIILAVNSLLIWCGMKLGKNAPLNIQVSHGVQQMGIGFKGMVLFLIKLLISCSLFH